MYKRLNVYKINIVRSIYNTSTYIFGINVHIQCINRIAERKIVCTSLNCVHYDILDI